MSAAERKQFRLPDVGEGLTEAEIVAWHVQPGDQVKTNQTVVEIETAKAVVELPSPFEGVVRELHATEGATVEVGAPLLSVDVTAEAEDADAAASDLPSPRKDEAVEPGVEGSPAPSAERQSVLVGYGPRTASSTRRRRRAQAPDEAGTPARDQAPAPSNAEPAAESAPGGSVRVLAKPPVRKLAKDLGVDLREVSASGPGGTITREDVEAMARGATVPWPGAAAPWPGMAAPQGQREERIPIKGVRKWTAEAMVASAFTAPHVTEFLAVDVTPTMELVTRLRARPEFEGVKVSPLLLAAKAMVIAVRRNPEINASWDDEAQEIVLKRYINLGIAAATQRGLLVPNIKDADRLSLPDLARTLVEVTEVARQGRTQPADMAGTTITITNVGVFGIDTGTPIIPPGQAAILAFGAVRPTPWVHEGEVTPRQVTQLALSFDHRLVDGELGSRFLADVGAILADPSLALVWS